MNEREKLAQAVWEAAEELEVRSDREAAEVQFAVTRSGFNPPLCAEELWEQVVWYRENELHLAGYVLDTVNAIYFMMAQALQPSQVDTLASA